MPKRRRRSDANASVAANPANEPHFGLGQNPAVIHRAVVASELQDSGFNLTFRSLNILVQEKDARECLVAIQAILTSDLSIFSLNRRRHPKTEIMPSRVSPQANSARAELAA